MTSQMIANRDKLRAYERIRNLAYHISTAVERKGDSYLVDEAADNRPRRHHQHAPFLPENS
jgi:hypothetical protein